MPSPACVAPRCAHRCRGSVARARHPDDEVEAAVPGLEHTHDLDPAAHIGKYDLLLSV
jgi:hypothetical protein